MQWIISLGLKSLITYLMLTTLANSGHAQGDSDAVEVQVHIIGFGMSDGDRVALEQAARDGGASFEHVDDVGGLDGAMGAASGLGGVTASGIESEPNNNFGHANDISPVAQFTGTIHPKGDADWLRFQVNHQGELRLLSQSVPADVDLAVRLWNANRDVVAQWQHALAVGGVLDASFDLDASGEYTLELRDGRNNADSTDPYQIKLAFSPTADSGERNNSFGAATPISLDANIRASILPKSDSDWYRVEVQEQGQLRISLDPVPAGLDMIFRVWNAQRDVSHGWLSPLAVGGANLQSIDLPAEGVYTIEVRDGGNDARSIEPYHLGLNFTASGDRGEPNDRFGQASPLDPDGAISATILPKGDSDWYRIEVAGQGQLEVSFDPVPRNLDMIFRVWNANRDVAHNWLSPLSVGGPNNQLIDLPAPGAYIVEVRDGGNDGRSVEPYHLGLNFTPTGDSAEPNNQFGEAVRIALNGVIQGTILPKGDSDWYRFDAPSAGSIEIQIGDVDPKLDIAFRVWNANRDVIHNWVRPLAKGGDTTATVSLKEPGRYVIEVRDGGNDERSIQPYTLKTKGVGAL